MPPEYILHGHISTALDVYSFGIVVLEIVSGRKITDSQKLDDETNLRQWVGVFIAFDFNYEHLELLSTWYHIDSLCSIP